jgi:hypothetical protein
MSGQIVAEAVLPEWLSLLHMQQEDTCFPKTVCGDYQRGKMRRSAIFTTPV